MLASTLCCEHPFRVRIATLLLKTNPHAHVYTANGGGWYAGTKYAIEALTEGLRMEFAGTDIRIACLEPGLVDTNLQGHWETPATELLGVTHPLSPADVARIIRFMLEQPSHIRIPRIMVLPGEHEV